MEDLQWVWGWLLHNSKTSVYISHVFGVNAEAMRVLLFWGWGGVMTFFSTSTTWYVMLRWCKSVTGNVLNKLGQVCAWNKKIGTFPRSSRDTKLQFRCGKALYDIYIYIWHIDFPSLRRPFHGILTAILPKKNKNVQITTVQFRSFPPSLMSSPARPFTGVQTIFFCL